MKEVWHNGSVSCKRHLCSDGNPLGRASCPATQITDRTVSLYTAPDAVRCGVPGDMRYLLVGMEEHLHVQLQTRCMPASAYLSATRRMFFVFQPWMSCSSMIPPFGGELGSAK